MPAALVAEDKIRADADAVNLAEIARELLDEFAARLPAEIGVKGNDERGIGA